MNKKSNFLFCFFIAFIVFIFYSHTLNYPWKYFDEQIIYNETILPIAKSLPQVFEYISSFGLKNYFEASNPFYSSISNIRCDPINNLITLFVFYLFQKNPFNYHLLSLILHLLNTCVLFLILNKISLSYLDINKIRLPLISILTLIWALHPVNVESILFTTNWSAILTYSFCLFVIWYYLEFCLGNNKGAPWHAPTLFVLFLIPLFTYEYSVTVPFILFFYTYANHNRDVACNVSTNALIYSIRKTLPLWLALAIFIINFSLSPTKENIHNSISNSVSVILERIFWFSPQIFIHFLKLIFFPIHLSIDQTAMVKISKLLFSPYSLFCIVFVVFFLIGLLLSFLFIERRGVHLFFVAFAPFLIALLPFLHILSPTYCIASERYLYFPLLILIFGLSHFVSLIFHKGAPWRALTMVILFILLILFGTRAYIRTLDWKDSVSFYTSTLKEAPNDLFKGMRLEILGSILSAYYKDTESQAKGKEYLNESINILSESIQKLEDEKEKYQDKIPEIIKLYGLDPKIIQAKTAYLLAFTKMGLEGDTKEAFEILRPHMQDMLIIDTQILDLYVGLLFSSNSLDEAESILNYSIKRKLSSLVLIASSELYKLKYKNFPLAEELLKKSFKYFPYDVQTLSALKKFYLDTNKTDEFAKFSYLYGARTHSEDSLRDAYKIYTSINNEDMAKKVMLFLSKD